MSAYTLSGLTAQSCSSAPFQEGICCSPVDPGLLLQVVDTCTCLCSVVCCRAASSVAFSEVSDAQAVARSTSAVQAVKAAVAELRVDVKSTISHREKCSILLSAAMAASLALEQVACIT